MVLGDAIEWANLIDGHFAECLARLYAAIKNKMSAVSKISWTMTPLSMVLTSEVISNPIAPTIMNAGR